MSTMYLETAENMDDYQAATARFVRWFKDMGGVFRHDLIAIIDQRSLGRGRGIIAIEDIPADTILFKVPRRIILSAETSDLGRKMPGIFRGRGTCDTCDGNRPCQSPHKPLDGWQSLILVLLYELLKGEASRWKPYLDLLPRKFDTPVFWTDDELRELEGTMLTPESTGRNEALKTIRTVILPIVQRHHAVFHPEGTRIPPPDVLGSLALYVGSTIMAYAFDLTPDEEEADDEGDGWVTDESEGDGWVEDTDDQGLLGMVPMADMLNANATFNAMVNHRDSCLDATSLGRTLAAGEEVLNHYDALSSAELLRRYGYVTPEHRRYDEAELPWDLLRDKLSIEVHLFTDEIYKIEAKLKQHKLQDSYIFERDSGEPDDEGRLIYDAKIRQLPEGLEQRLTCIIFHLARVKYNNFVTNTNKVSMVYRVIARALRHRLRQYPDAINRDEAILAQENLPKRNRMAVEVRLGEKKLLQEALDFVEVQKTKAEEKEKEDAAKKPAKRVRAKAKRGEDDDEAGEPAAKKVKTKTKRGKDDDEASKLAAKGVKAKAKRGKDDDDIGERAAKRLKTLAL